MTAKDLSRDHKPDDADEMARIKQWGGFVSPAPDPGLSARVYLDAEFTMIGLAMSRSIGTDFNSSLSFSFSITHTHSLCFSLFFSLNHTNTLSLSISGSICLFLSVSCLCFDRSSFFI